MKNHVVLIVGIGLLTASIGAAAQAQIVVIDLSAALEEGKVKLVDARGTGASSGTSVEGYLENLVEMELNINVYMDKPLFLVNQGKGQDMIASAVCLENGMYWMHGSRSFIILKPRLRTKVVFFAYCVDFEKDNPSSNETFEVAEPPKELINVLANITDYARQNPHTNITGAAQLAIWLAKGESLQKIAEKFEFTEEDEQLAKKFLPKE